MKLKLLFSFIFLSFSAQAQDNWNLCYKDDRSLEDTGHFEYFRVGGNCAPNNTCKCVKYSYDQGKLTSKTYHGFKDSIADFSIPLNDPAFLFRTFDEIYPDNLPNIHELLHTSQKERIINKLSANLEVPLGDIHMKMNWLEKTLRENLKPKLQALTPEHKAKLLEKLSNETTLQQCNPALYQKLENLVTEDKVFISAKELDAPHHIFYYDKWGMFGDRIVLFAPNLKHQGAGLNLWGTVKELKLSNFLISMLHAYLMMTINTDPRYQYIINQIQPMTIHEVIASKEFDKDFKHVLENAVIKPYQKELQSAGITFIVDNIPCVSN